jgi:hypothetical protein
MAKNIVTSGDYNVKAGNGSAGTNQIKLDSKTVRITGDLTVDGSQVVQNVTNTTIEDQFMELNRNNSTAGSEDSGIIFNGGSSDNAILMFDASANEFIMATTPTNFQDGSTTKYEVAVPGSLTYRHIRVATTPSDANHATSKSYVDSQVSGAAAFTLKVAGDDSTQVSVASGNTLQFSGGPNIHTHASEPDTVKVTLAERLTGIDSITGSTSNADITISANSTGSVVIDDVLTFPSNRSGEPTATAVTKMFAQTPSGGGTGLFFVNTSVSSGAAGELISKKKATALAIALG